MSSDYLILCLSHDPAIVTGAEWQQPEPALAAAATPEQYEELREHVRCDLLVGRYSYPLVEVACPSARHDGVPTHYPYHPHSAQWIDVAWLRLLWWCRDAMPGTPVARAASQVPGCWSPTRVRRLRLELGIGEKS